MGANILNQGSKFTSHMHQLLMMSLKRWLVPSSSSVSQLLPEGDDEATKAANKQVSEILQVSKERKKRGPNKTNDDVTRVKIAKYTCENGNKAAVEKFSDELGHKVSESSVRNMKKAYLEKLKLGKDPDSIKSLPHASRGRPLMLGDYDAELVK